MFFGQMPEQWLPRAKEDLWPAEEERLEESLEDLGAAAGRCLLMGVEGGC